MGGTCPPGAFDLVVSTCVLLLRLQIHLSNHSEKIRGAFLRKDRCIMWLSLSVPLGQNLMWKLTPRDTCRAKLSQSSLLRSEALAPGDGISKCSAGTIIHCLHKEEYRRKKRGCGTVPCKGLILATDSMSSVGSTL